MRETAVFICALFASSCASPEGATPSQALQACARGAAHVEVEGRGTVTRVLGTRTSASGVHEGFFLRMDRISIRVEDNTDITGPIPLRAGEPIQLRGQYECSDGVIHWTHHDPAFRHAGGYIIAGGRRYS